MPKQHGNFGTRQVARAVVHRGTSLRSQHSFRVEPEMIGIPTLLTRADQVDRMSILQSFAAVHESFLAPS
jgi:hypothetical protein